MSGPYSPCTPAHPRDARDGLTRSRLGTECYPWLSALFPPRPVDARKCSACGGTGRLDSGSHPGSYIYCLSCAALGWVAAGQSAVAVARSPRSLCSLVAAERYVGRAFLGTKEPGSGLMRSAAGQQKQGNGESRRNHPGPF